MIVSYCLHPIFFVECSSFGSPKILIQSWRSWWLINWLPNRTLCLILFRFKFLKVYKGKFEIYIFFYEGSIFFYEGSIFLASWVLFILDKYYLYEENQDPNPLSPNFVTIKLSINITLLIKVLLTILWTSVFSLILQPLYFLKP